MNLIYKNRTQKRRNEFSQSILVPLLISTFVLVRFLLGTADFDIIADIRLSPRNARVLHHNGFKFSKVKSSSWTEFWVCQKRYVKSCKCKATVTTKNINGTIMMKLNESEHNHEPSANEI